MKPFDYSAAIRLCSSQAVWTAILRTIRARPRVSLDTDKFVDSVGVGVVYLRQRSDWLDDENEKAGVKVLVLQLATHAAEENALVNELDRFAKDSLASGNSANSSKSGASLPRLNDLLGDIELSIINIRQSFRTLAPQWSARHPMTAPDVGRFADGELFSYIGSSGRIPLTPVSIRTFTTILRNEAARVRKLASAVAAGIQQQDMRSKLD